MMFQAEMEMKIYLCEDEEEDDNSLETNVLSSAICIETLVNMRTVHSKENCLSKRRLMFFIRKERRIPLTFGKFSWTQKLALYEEMIIF